MCMLCCCYFGRADLLLMEEVHKAKVSGQVDIAQKQIAVRFPNCQTMVSV